MSVSVVVPFNPGDPQRDRNWAYVRARYERLHPDWEIITESCPGEWRKGIAANRGVQRASGDVVVLADGDCLLSAEALTEALRRLEGEAWVIPHEVVWRLSRRVTQLIHRDLIRLERLRSTDAVFVFRGPIGGGVAVMRRQDYVGIDPGFTGWGGEDVSFARAMDTLVGPHARLGATLWHLHHRPMPRMTRKRAFPENEALANRYLDANGDPEAMRALCRSYAPCPA